MYTVVNTDVCIKFNLESLREHNTTVFDTYEILFRSNYEIFADMGCNNRPQIPPDVSADMEMCMSTTEHMPSNLALDSSTPQNNASNAAETQPQYSAALPIRTRTPVIGRPVAELQRDSNKTRERVLSLQRIQLAEQLSNERKLQTTLETRASVLEDKLALLKLKNEALETECAKLHEQIFEANKQLVSQATDFEKRYQPKLQEVDLLQSKLQENARKLADTTMNRDAIQQRYDEASTSCKHQADNIKHLEKKLTDARGEIDDLSAKGRKLRDENDKHRQRICETEKVIRSDQLKLEEKLANKTDEITRLKNLTITLQDKSEKSAKKAENTERELVQLKQHQRETTKMQETLEKSLDRHLKESQELQKSMDELQKSVKPFGQTVVICVDVSGSLSQVYHEVKQVYRDVLHMIKAVNGEAKVAVVIHGNDTRINPSPTQVISDATFGILDSINRCPDSEDYAYCLRQANTIFKQNPKDKPFLLLIGDGDVLCSPSDHTAISETCRQLDSSGIPAHSIVIPNGPSSCYNPSARQPLTMFRISELTHGQSESKDTYFSAFKELLATERKKVFKLS